MKWKIISSDQEALCIHTWDNEYVVYNSLSGDTHLLNLTAGQLLLKLQRSPMDSMSLANLITPTDKSKSSLEHELQIEQLLAELNTLNLVEEY